MVSWWELILLNFFSCCTRGNDYYIIAQRTKKKKKPVRFFLDIFSAAKTGDFLLRCHGIIGIKGAKEIVSTRHYLPWLISPSIPHYTVGFFTAA